MLPILPYSLYFVDYLIGFYNVSSCDIHLPWGHVSHLGFLSLTYTHTHTHHMHVCLFAAWVVLVYSLAAVVEYWIIIDWSIILYDFANINTFYRIEQSRFPWLLVFVIAADYDSQRSGSVSSLFLRLLICYKHIKSEHPSLETLFQSGFWSVIPRWCSIILIYICIFFI